MKKGIKKSHFDVTHGRQTTAKADGTLYPIFAENVMPGSVFKGQSEIVARLMPLLYPIYGEFDLMTHWFFVPNRLVWDNWRQFIAPEFVEVKDDEFVFPSFRVGPVSGSTPGPDVVDQNWFGAGSLADHLGLQFVTPEKEPLTSPTEEYFSLLPFRAYQLIWNEWYRDVDLQEPIEFNKGDGVVIGQDEVCFMLRKKCWEKDYFTSARPYAQKGDPVTVATGFAQGKEPFQIVQGDTQLGGGINIDSSTKGLRAGDATDLSPITGFNSSFSIKDLRFANTMQKFLEKILRGGSRYNEQLKSIFGVTVPDSRLQRPEFLGGGRQPIVISEVLQSSQSDETPLGTFAGHGISSGSHNWNYVVPEHGMIFGLMSILPRSAYMNVIRRQWTYRDRFDFPTPDFAHLGEQEIKNYELNGFRLYDTLPSYDPMAVFGYQDRFAECKNIPSTVHGKFRTDPSLVRFHTARLGQYYLNAAFLQCNQATDQIDRVFALEESANYDPLLITVKNKISAVLPLPKRSIPKL